MYKDSNFKVVKDENLVLPTSEEDESGLAIINDEVMEDLQQLGVIKQEEQVIPIPPKP